MKPSVLVVDDDPVIRTTLQRFLQAKGCEATTAANGKEALRQFQKKKPDLIILDVRMPEMGGLDTLREIRRLDSQVGVMVISGLADVEEARECMRLGAYDYLVKPMDFDYLETSILGKLLLTMPGQPPQPH